MGACALFFALVMAALIGLAATPVLAADRPAATVTPSGKATPPATATPHATATPRATATLHTTPTPRAMATLHATATPGATATLHTTAEVSAPASSAAVTAVVQSLVGGAALSSSSFSDVLPQMLRAMPDLPVMLGMNKPHTYLILLQNNHELRPTGGFITAVGRITLEKGLVKAMEFDDSYSIFTLGAPYPAAPKAMQQYMQIPYLTLRDSNWSPDLLTTSSIAHTLYTMDTGLDFDTLVTVDLSAVEKIVAALGPLKLEGVDEEVTGENILEIMKELWARPADADPSTSVAAAATGSSTEKDAPVSGTAGEGAAGGDTGDKNASSKDASSKDAAKWWRERKEFIPALAHAALSRVMAGKVQPLDLAAAVVTALNQRDIQVLTDAEKAPLVAGVLSDLAWDGAMEPVKGADYLALVDMNMGYNKVDAVIDRALEYTVTWPDAGGPAEATAVVTYTHTYTGEANLCEAIPQYGASYDDMIKRCYFDYVRLYVPSGAELISVSGVDKASVSDARSERGTRTFAGYFKLEPGEEKAVTFRYRLPEAITPEEYALRIQRQSGTDALPVKLHVGGESASVLLEDGRVDWSPPAP